MPPRFKTPTPCPEIAEPKVAICVVLDDDRNILNSFYDMSTAKSFAENYEEEHGCTCLFKLAWIQ